MYTWVANTRLNHSLCFGSPSPEEVVRETALALLVVVCKPARLDYAAKWSRLLDYAAKWSRILDYAAKWSRFLDHAAKW